MRIDIKPFSINEAWTGRRFKTAAYKVWREMMGYLLLKEKRTNYGKKMLLIHYDFYVKNYTNTDLSNLVKTAEDALVENGILTDDRYVKRFLCEKHKSEIEYIEINISTY